MAEIHIGSEIKSIIKQNGIHVTDFANKIFCCREYVYKIYKYEKVNDFLLGKIIKALEQDFCIDLSQSRLAAYKEEHQNRAIGQFMSVVSRLVENYQNGQIMTCPANYEVDGMKMPFPDYAIEPWLIMVTIGESLEERFKRFKFDSIFKFSTISDDTGASVILCYSNVFKTHSINIVLDYKTKEEWENTFRLAIDTAEKYYNSKTKFLNDSPKGF